MAAAAIALALSLPLCWRLARHHRLSGAWWIPAAGLAAILAGLIHYAATPRHKDADRIDTEAAGGLLIDALRRSYDAPADP